MSNWDKYFFDICNTVAGNSKCLSRKIGAIITKNNKILCTGYNGPPRGVPHCDMRLVCNHPDEYLKFKFRKHNLNDNQILNKCPRQYLNYKSGEGLDICIAGHAERNCIVSAAEEGIRVKGTTMCMNCPISCTPCLIEIINSGIVEIVVTDLIYYDTQAQYLIDNSNIKIRKFNL